MRFTNNYSAEISRLKNEIETANCIIIGAGSGLSTAAGFTYSGERFEKYFSDFIKKYGLSDMYSGGFYPFDSLEEFWAYWSRYIFINRYAESTDDTYKRLFEVVKNKDYFVLTTNVDHQFQKAGFDKSRLFYTQGDYGLFQCSEPCHNSTYDNEQIVLEMYNNQKNMRVPTELIPKCPKCGKPMSMNLRCDDTFVEDVGWHKSAENYSEFLKAHDNQHILFLELGVGMNTPSIIKFPFWRMTQSNKKAIYACINSGEAKDRVICVDDDIKKIISLL